MLLLIRALLSWEESTCVKNITFLIVLYPEQSLNIQIQPRVSLFHPRYALSFKSNLRKYFHLPNIPQWFNHNISNAISSLCHTAAGAEETGEVVGIVGGVGPGVQIIVIILEIFLHLFRWIQ